MIPKILRNHDLKRQLNLYSSFEHLLKTIFLYCLGISRPIKNAFVMHTVLLEFSLGYIFPDKTGNGVLHTGFDFGDDDTFTALEFLVYNISNFINFLQSLH